MSNNKQSSVEWAIYQLGKIDMLLRFGEIGVQKYNRLHEEITTKAKEMHKEECIKYYVDSIDYGDMGQHIRESFIQIAEKMYNETFGE